MDDNESNFSYKTYLWGIIGCIIFALIYTPLVWLPTIRVCSQTDEGLNNTDFWIINCIGVASFIAIYGLIKVVVKKWYKEKWGKYMDSKTQIIDQYFKLSDLASNDEQALHEIIQLFSKKL